MKNHYKIYIYIGLVIVLSTTVIAQQTESVSFKVRTTTPSGNFSPKNIGAIWVEDLSGKFIKTLQIWADKRVQYLYTWNSISKGNKVDAVSSATLSSHQTHSVYWNLKDNLGNIVPNGQYKLKIEMTDQHAQGPLSSFTFPVGEASNSLSIPDLTNFHDMVLSWSSVITDVKNDKVFPTRYQLDQNYPNPFNPTTTINFSIPKDGNVKLNLFDVLGNEVVQLANEYKSAGNYSYTFDASHLPSGIYIYTIRVNSFVATKKMLLLK